MHDLNGRLFLNATSFSALSFLFPGAPQISVGPLTTISASLSSQKSIL